MRCTTDHYDALYARWLPGAGRLLDEAAYLPGMKVMDLCGGTGAVSRECLRRGADPSTIHLLDLNPRCDAVGITSHTGDANHLERILSTNHFGTFDLIVCRQAAAYLDWDPLMIGWLKELLKPGGRLVFNMFTEPRWALKTYKYEGKRFFEASAYLGRTIWHVQAGLGVGYDVTRFQWHNPMVLKRRLGFHFDRLSIKARGRSQTWTCIRG
jgi:SAM-dependent methyltransferase